MAGSDKDERKALIAAIAEAEESVARASAELSHREAHLVEPRSRLDQLTDQKLELFRTLFRSRKGGQAESCKAMGAWTPSLDSRTASRRASRELDGLEVGDAMHSGPARRLPLNT